MPKTHDLGRLFVTSLNLSEDAPLFHTAITAEYDHGGRNCKKSLVIKTPFHSRGRWFGLRRSWMSVQVKLPFLGEPLAAGCWGIVVGWWFNPQDDGWSALARAVRLGKDDGYESVNFEDPTSASTRRSFGLISGRRAGGADDAGADG